MVLSFLIYEHWLPFHTFKPFKILFYSVLSFSAIQVLHFFVKFISKLFLCTIENGIVFLISTLNCLLLMCRNVVDLVSCSVSCDLAELVYSSSFLGEFPQIFYIWVCLLWIMTVLLLNSIWMSLVLFLAKLLWIEFPVQWQIEGMRMYGLIFLKIYFYIFIWLHWVFVAVRGLCLVVESRGYAPVVLCTLLITVVSLVAELGS